MIFRRHPVPQSVKIPAFDLHRTFNSHCWYCGKQLGEVFTSVKKRGITLRVHSECRPEALGLAHELGVIE